MVGTKTSGGRTCHLCSKLSSSELLELDTMVGDPSYWPSSIWSIFSPPEGGLPASYRRFGAIRTGRKWLDDHGYTGITDATLRRHVRYDVVHVPRSIDELVQLGIVQTTTSDRIRIPEAPALDAGAVIRYYNAGVQMGEAALRLTAQRLNAMIAAGDEPDPKLVMKLAELGTRLAMSQATLQSRGAKFHAEQDEDDAFRGSDAGPRIGHNRIREIEGETRAIKDEGPADRERYNARAREEGSPVLD